MQAARYHLDAYRKSCVETASPLGLIIMLYDGALSKLANAERHMKEGQRDESGACLTRAQDIIYELMACLDMERGGEIARNLYRIYEYMTFRLVQANLRQDAEIIMEVRGHLSQLREAWEEVEKKTKVEKAVGSAGFR